MGICIMIRPTTSSVSTTPQYRHGDAKTLQLRLLRVRLRLQRVRARLQRLRRQVRHQQAHQPPSRHQPV